MLEKFILAITFLIIASITIHDMVTYGYSNKQMLYLTSAVVLVGYLWWRSNKKQK